MKSIRGFFEYKILPDTREAYLNWVIDYNSVVRANGLNDFAILESNHRPNQFIETFTIESMDRYESIVSRLKEQVEYNQMQQQLDQMLENGRESMKIWFFTEI